MYTLNETFALQETGPKAGDDGQSRVLINYRTIFLTFTVYILRTPSSSI